MAVKTITIDLEAYDRLANLKKEGQSFSQVIKEHVPDRRSTGRDLLEVIHRAGFSDEFVEIMDEIIADRRKSPAREPRSCDPSGQLFRRRSDPRGKTRQIGPRHAQADRVVQRTARIEPIYGRLLADSKRRGLTLPTMDLLIAAAALADGAELVTADRRHFARIPDLRLIAY